MPQESLSPDHQSAASSDSAGKRRLREDDHEVRRPAKKARRIDAEAYILIHTTGYNELKPVSGDGAYSKWLHDYFTGEVTRGRDGRAGVRCVAVEQMKYQGVRDLKGDSAIDLEVCGSFARQFNDILEGIGPTVASTVIVDWHLRATGNPASWTGRGASNRLIEQMRDHAKEHGLRFKLIYTVHEAPAAVTRMKRTEEANPFPYILALDPVVKKKLGTALNGGSDPDGGFALANVAESQVPRLMQSLHTETLEKVLHYAVPHDAIDETSLSFRAAGTAILQKLRLTNFKRPGLGIHGAGLLIFGTIEKRHGLNKEDLDYLAQSLHRMPDDFHIAIAGNPKDKSLVREIKALAVKWPRIKLIGPVPNNSLDLLAGYRYALSMDKEGFRNNASAMVSVIGAGKLLFRRKSADEETKELINRAVSKITAIETSGANGNTEFLGSLENDFELMRASEPSRVGRRLDKIYRGLALGGRGIPTRVLFPGS